MVRRRVCAAISIAAACIVYCVCISSGPVRADEDDARVLKFSGRDIWRNGAFMHGGLLFAPGGFERDGLMFKIMFGGGVYRYTSGSLGDEQVIGAEWMHQAMAGVRIKRGNAELKYFFGPEWQRHKLWPGDQGNKLAGQNFGLRMSGELWYEPTRDNLIVGDVSVSSIETSHTARLALGWRIAEELFAHGVYVGPETQYFGSDGYRHRRFGLHVTSMKTEDTEWSASVGLAEDSDRRSSVYVRLGLSQKITD